MSTPGNALQPADRFLAGSGPATELGRLRLRARAAGRRGQRAGLRQGRDLPQRGLHVLNKCSEQV